MRHFLVDDDLSAAEQLSIFDLADTLKAEPYRLRPFAGPRTVAVLFDQVDSSGEGADMSFALLHGLFWLTANLAQSPLMLIIDDLH